MKSMTGYGKGEAHSDSRKVTVELKSVNNRYLDVNSRFPKSLGFIEEVVKKQIQERVKRGNVDVYYTYEITGERDKQVTLDESLAREYVAVAQKVCNELGVQNDVTTSSLLRMPDVVSVTSAEDNEEELKTLFAQATKQAVIALDEMRETEGANAKADLVRLVENIETSLSEVKKRAPFVVTDYRDKITKRIAELLAGVEIDEARIASEVAVFADKCDINEEISRLSSHIGQFYDILESDDQQGRKLDFLSQEMNREINTMGSKANDLTLTKLVLEMKNELEKIKEQIRNVE